MDTRAAWTFLIAADECDCSTDTTLLSIDIRSTKPPLTQAGYVIGMHRLRDLSKDMAWRIPPAVKDHVDQPALA